MVTPNQLSTWNPGQLNDIGDRLITHRRALLEQTDELWSAAVPMDSYSFSSAMNALRAHNQLASTLATQVAEVTEVIRALETAAGTIESAKRSLEAAYSTASSHSLAINRETGHVSVTRTPKDSSDAQYLYTQRNYTQQYVDDALRMAAAADEELTAVLTRAATSDVNTVGSLDAQRRMMEFLDRPESEQVAYLLEHPEQFAELGPWVSDEVKVAIGQQLATDFDAAARDTSVFVDPAQVERYADLIDAFGGDPLVMGTMYERFGPDGTLGLFNSINAGFQISGSDEDLVRVAEGLRTGLQSASHNPGFDGDRFARDLVRYATYDLPRDTLDAFDATYASANTGNASVLDFLLREGEFSEDFVRGTVLQLEQFERENGDWGLDWAYRNGTTPLDSIGYSWQDMPWAPDPMSKAMGQMGHHPQLGMEFFGDLEDGQGRVEYFLSERDWSRDGFKGISEAFLGLGTDPTNFSERPAQTSQLVSEFFDRIPNNSAFNADNAGAAAEPIGDLLKHYMPAVESAAISESLTDNPARIDPYDTEAFLPSWEHYPVLDKVDLDGLLKVVLSEEGGIARMAEGVAAFRQEQLFNFAGTFDDPAAGKSELQAILSRSSHLEGYMQHQVGDIAVDIAKSRDERMGMFTNLVSEAVGLIPMPGADLAGDLVGELGTKVLEAAWSHAQEIPSDKLTEVFGNSEAAVRAVQTAAAGDASDSMVIGNYLALVQAGILDVPANMTDTWMVDGRLVTLEETATNMQVYRREAASTMTPLVDPYMMGLMFANAYAHLQ